MLGSLPEVHAGKFELIYSQQLLLPEGEVGTVTFSVMNSWRPTFTVNFKVDGTSTEQTINIRANPETPSAGHIELTNFSNPLGTATKVPVPVGVAIGLRPVHVMLAHWKIGTVNCLSIQFFLGGAQ